MFGSDGDVVWPTELQGMKLGNIVQDIREDGKMVFGYKDRMQKLNDLGFSWEVWNMKYENGFTYIHILL